MAKRKKHGPLSLLTNAALDLYQRLNLAYVPLLEEKIAALEARIEEQRTLPDPANTPAEEG